MKFKVGDRVKVMARKHGHCFDIGEVIKIKEVNREGYICSSLERNNIWWLRDDEVAEVKFTKSDLKDGDIVTYRDGQKRTVFCNKLINESGFSTQYLTSYNESLKKTELQKSQTDIVKVERPVKYETVFERKEEILDETEKRYLANVIKPFKDKVKYIVKYDNPLRIKKEYLRIKMVNDEEINFPEFKKDFMYKGMKEAKRYTLKELGL